MRTVRFSPLPAPFLVSFILLSGCASGGPAVLAFGGPPGDSGTSTSADDGSSGGDATGTGVSTSGPLGGGSSGSSGGSGDDTGTGGGSSSSGGIPMDEGGACGPSCNGCCSNGTCARGFNDNACGTGAVMCQDCTLVGGTCQPDATCSNPGGPGPGGSSSSGGSSGGSSSGFPGASSSSGAGGCSRSSCPNGCCQSGTCHGGTVNTRCGTGGGACVDCTSTGQICQAQRCGN
jgi:hypothetical protein